MITVATGRKATALVAVVVAVVVMHRAKEQGKADRLREDILQVHGQELGEAATR